jgi:hypothetical protein
LTPVVATETQSFTTDVLSTWVLQRYQKPVIHAWEESWAYPELPDSAVDAVRMWQVPEVILMSALPLSMPHTTS